MLGNNYHELTGDAPGAEEEAPDTPQGVGHRCLPKGMTEEVDLHLRIVATLIPRTVITRHCLGFVAKRKCWRKRRS